MFEPTETGATSQSTSTWPRTELTETRYQAVEIVRNTGILKVHVVALSVNREHGLDQDACDAYMNIYRIKAHSERKRLIL